MRNLLHGLLVGLVLAVPALALPAVASASVPSELVTNEPAPQTYGPGQGIYFLVQFDQTVIVNTAGGTPSIQLDIGGTPRQAAYYTGSGSDSMYFVYNVVSG